VSIETLLLVIEILRFGRLQYFSQDAKPLGLSIACLHGNQIQVEPVRRRGKLA
jgi:hypothetical protein